MISPTLYTPIDESASTPPFAPPEHPAPDPWGWHRRALLVLRSRLSRERDEHRSAACEPIGSERADRVDFASEETELVITRAELDAEETLLGEIEAALQRLRAGTYGVCEETGRPIPAERLRALPWTRFCREAAERREQQASSKREVRS